MVNKRSKVTDYISGKEITAGPEEIEAVQPLLKQLVNDYNYPKNHIVAHPQWKVKSRPSDRTKQYPVDIAIFTGSKHTDDNLYAIAECKRKTRKDGLAQLKIYLSLSNAKLGIWFNGKEYAFVHKIVKNNEIEFQNISNIPLCGQRIEDLGLFKRKDLIKTNNLKPVFNTIRNYLAANNIGSTLDSELMIQLINIIFCKIYDERFTKMDSIVRFRAGLNEDAKSVADRIKTIFQEVKEQYSDVFTVDDKITLSEESIAYIVGQLQQYCLINAKRDAVGDAFETFISPSLRGGQGQFFTPRNVINLLVHMTDPGISSKIIDPACGSGGFLIESLRYVWHKERVRDQELNWPEAEISANEQKIAISNFRGIDKEQFLAKTAKAYMALLGDGRGGIYCENSLDRLKNWSNNAQANIQLGTFDLVLTNPPYGSKLKINARDILRQYALGYEKKRTDKLLKSQTPQVLFIERSLELLKPNGILGIVAPESMFCNPSHQYIMEYIEKHAEIEAIISMPEDLFQPHTHAKTCVVIMRKLNVNKVGNKEVVESINPDDEIFMGIANWCGHDSRGLEIPKDDIPKIQKQYELFKANKLNTYNSLGFTVRQKDIVNHIYLPKYYNPEIKNQISSLMNGYDLVTIGALKDKGLISISTGNEVGKLAYGTGNIPFIRTSDIANWDIKIDPKQGISEDIYEGLKEKQDIKPYDILMVRDGTYLIGTCAMLLPDDVKIVYQSHIYKIRSNDFDKLDPYLLLGLLSSPIVKRQIRSKQFTQDIIDTLGGRINELILPIPKDKKQQENIINNVKNVYKKKEETKKLMRKIVTQSIPELNIDSNNTSFTLTDL